LIYFTLGRRAERLFRTAVLNLLILANPKEKKETIKRHFYEKV